MVRYIPIRNGGLKRLWTPNNGVKHEKSSVSELLKNHQISCHNSALTIRIQDSIEGDGRFSQVQPTVHGLYFGLQRLFISALTKKTVLGSDIPHNFYVKRVSSISYRSQSHEVDVKFKLGVRERDFSFKRCFALAAK